MHNESSVNEGGMRAYIYGRYSSHSQKDTSIEQQFKEIYQYCEQHGIRIMGEYADRAISGKTDSRPEFQRCIKDCAKGKVQLLICWKVDRFARNRYDSAMYKARLKKYGVRVIYAKESIPEGPEGILLESILEGSAEYYSANLAQNIRRGLKANALECKVNGSLPLGYCKGSDGRYAIEPIGAALVKEIYSLYNSDVKVVDICNMLNARGCRTSRGTLFNKNSLRTILKNKRYLGIYICGDIRIEGGIPALITKEEFDVAQEKLKKHAYAPASARSEVDYLLTGKLFCGHCGSAMIGASGTGTCGGKYTYYACSCQRREKNCKKKPVKQLWLEEFVVKNTLNYILVPDVMKRIAEAAIELQKKEHDEGDIPLLEKQLREVDNKLKNVMSAIEQGIITSTTKARLQELESRKLELSDAIDLAHLNETKLTKGQILFWLEKFKDGNVDDPDFCWQVISNFVSAVYVYDDHIKIAYNYTKNSVNTVDLAFIEGLSSLTNPVLKCSPLAHEAPPK